MPYNCLRQTIYSLNLLLLVATGHDRGKGEDGEKCPVPDKYSPRDREDFQISP